jgi:hypothetical protein
MLRWIGNGLISALLLVPSLARACSLCNSLQGQSLRQDAVDSKLVLYGTLTNPRLNAPNEAAGGTTDLVIDKIIKLDPFLGNQKILTLPRYVPADPKNPPKFLVFCDVFKDKDGKERIDPYRGVPVKSEAVVGYLQGALALDPKNRTRTLLYYFNYLDHRDEDVANDAFLEFAKANDQEIGQLAGKLPPEKLRGWLKDTNTPMQRLGLYGFLLGGCGTDKDAELLRSLLLNSTERTANALDGLLGGYIQLRPREGWDFIQTLLGDDKRPFTTRFAVLRTLRFFHGWKPAETRKDVLRGLGAAVAQGDIADLAVEDLRRWQMWDLTREILAQYGKPSHATPIVRRAIVRYALCCPDADARRFIDGLRNANADLVKDVEESLQFEKR